MAPAGIGLLSRASWIGRQLEDGINRSSAFRRSGNALRITPQTQSDLRPKRRFAVSRSPRIQTGRPLVHLKERMGSPETTHW